MLAMMADNIEHVITYWLIYERFHSPALAGFAVISHWAPFLVFGITFGALAGKTYGAADFNVSATASSGLAVTFTASGNCTVVGTLVHITGAGSCTITAHQAGDTNYNAAPDVPQTFSIAKADQAPLAVTGPASVTYGTTGTATASGGPAR